MTERFIVFTPHSFDNDPEFFSSQDDGENVLFYEFIFLMANHFSIHSIITAFKSTGPNLSLVTFKIVFKKLYFYKTSIYIQYLQVHFLFSIYVFLSRLFFLSIGYYSNYN